MLTGQSHARLHEGLPLQLNAGACLSLRSRDSDCSACVEICPAEALTIEAASIAVVDSCTACGRCAATCPTGALRLERREAPLPVPQRGAPLKELVFECERIPAESAVAGAICVSCTGALSTTDLVKHYAASPAASLAIVDRGLCTDCPSGGGSCHPASAAVSLAAFLIEEVTHVPGRVSIVERALPRNIAARPVRRPLEEIDSSRRHFFRRALSVAQPEAPAPRPDRRARITDTPRRHLTEALRRLAAGGEGSLPAAFFPLIEITDSCHNHGVCAAICPTGALRSYEEGGILGLELDAAACIACGDCARGCPEKAIRLVPVRQGGDAPAGIERLTRHSSRECARCDDEFPARADEELCPACRKDVGLFTSGFQPGAMPNERA